MAVIEVVGDSVRYGDDADAGEGSGGVELAKLLRWVEVDDTYTVKAMDASRPTIPHLNGFDHSWGFSVSPFGSNVTITKSFLASLLECTRSGFVSLPS